MNKKTFFAFFKLLKVKILISALLSFSGAYLFANQYISNSKAFWFTFCGIALSAAGAAALNHSQEKIVDAKMIRTQNRPIANNELSQKTGYIFSFTLIIIGNIFLIIFSNITTLILSLLTVVTYNYIYTPLKQKSFINTYIGAIPGALPALCGWTAANATLAQPQAWTLFFAIVLWQLPHFFSIDWLYRQQYAAAGFEMLSKHFPSGAQNVIQSLIFSAILIPYNYLFFYYKQLSMLYVIIMTLISCIFFITCLNFSKNRSDTATRLSFRMSLLYLNGLFICILCNYLI